MPLEDNFTVLADGSVAMESGLEVDAEVIDEFDALVARVLGHGDGALLLKKMRDMTIEVPSYAISFGDLPNSATIDQFGQYREGQNSYTRFLEAAIFRATQGYDNEQN